jgi:hypothetical protein
MIVANDVGKAACVIKRFDLLVAKYLGVARSLPYDSAWWAPPRTMGGGVYSNVHVKNKSNKPRRGF